MASNPTPEDRAVLVALAEDLADGCDLHEVAIGIKQNTEAAIRAVITAEANAKLAYGNANTAVDNAYDDLQAADAAGAVVLKNCRLRLVKLFGSGYNSSWQTAGFPNQSTAVPDSQDARFALLDSLRVYFTATPASESTDMEATAALCLAAHAAISDARQAVNTSETNQSNAKLADAAALKTLRKRVRGLIDELGTLVADDDTRYEAFGLNIPANPSAPEGIGSLSVLPQGGGKAHASWSYATRMTGTRLMGRRVPEETEFSSLGTAPGLEKTLTGLAPGMWEIFAVPYNDGGDGAPSPTAAITVT